MRGALRRPRWRYEITGDRKIYQHVDYTTVLAVPYDMPVRGLRCTTTVVPLRLWSARAPKRIDMEYFNKGEYVTRHGRAQSWLKSSPRSSIPRITTTRARELRLKQHYFFTSATMQYIINNYKKHYGTDLTKLPEKVAVHINDTHPGLAIPELMRLLIDQENMTWEDALKVVAAYLRLHQSHHHGRGAGALAGGHGQDHSAPHLSDPSGAERGILQAAFGTSYPGQWERIGEHGDPGLWSGAYGQPLRARLPIPSTAFPSCTRKF